MKKRLTMVLLALCLGLLMTTSAFALSIYVDVAPNAYGSPDYPAWQEASLSAASTGTFINMLSGINPDNIGTTNFEIEDEVVYSFGDLGSRLTWVYWIPNETIESLTGRLTVSLMNIWDGDLSDFYQDYYAQTWITPSHLYEYNGGVVGLAGIAWWGAYGLNNEDALQADLAEWAMVSESWIFKVSLDREISSLTSNRDATSMAPVPEPGTLILLGGGLCGLFFYRRKAVH